MRIAVDTTVLIDLERDLEDAWAAIGALPEETELHLSSISAQEYLMGETSHDAELLHRILRAFTLLDHDRAAAARGAEAARAREANGARMGAADSFICGALLSNGITHIITRDATGFTGIEGLATIEY